MKNEIHRCGWCLSDPLYITYHDEEWGVPVHDDRKLFEFLILEELRRGCHGWLFSVSEKDIEKHLPTSTPKRLCDLPRSASKNFCKTPLLSAINWKWTPLSRMRMHSLKYKKNSAASINTFGSLRRAWLLQTLIRHWRILLRHQKSPMQWARTWKSAASSSADRPSCMLTCRRQGWSTTTWLTIFDITKYDTKFLRLVF